MFLGSKKGTMTNYVKYRLYYIGVNLIDRLGIHSIKTRKRLMQDVKKSEEVRFLIEYSLVTDYSLI